MNIIEKIAFAASMTGDDSDVVSEQSVRLNALYDRCTAGERALIDEVLICVCGWSMKSLRENEHRGAVRQ